LSWSRKFAIKATFDFTFIIDRVKTYYALEKNVEFGVGFRVLGDFE
jgi:hypothetical protein